MQWRSARDQHLQAWTTHQQVGHEVCGFQNLLKIIEEQQALFVLEESTHLLGEKAISLFTLSQYLRHRLWNERGIAESRQVYPRQAIGKISAKVVGDLEREPGLAYPAWPSHREQTYPALSQEVKCLSNLLLPSK